MLSSKDYFAKERYPPYLYYCNTANNQEDEKRQQQQQQQQSSDVGDAQHLNKNNITRTSSLASLIMPQTSVTTTDNNNMSSPPNVSATTTTTTLSNNSPNSRMNSTTTSTVPSDAIIMDHYYESCRRLLLLTLHDPSSLVAATWRLKERMKTVGICLVLALNIGTDPPDTYKPTPCAKLQTWLDPTTISRSKAGEQIAERLEAQYSKWQQRAKLKCKRALDPTMEEVRALCLSMRRNAKTERVLLHYNGHGVPKCTSNGEIWLFDKNHTQYIPLSVVELKSWLGKPSVIVLDCSNAGVLLPFFVSNNTTATTTNATSTNPQQQKQRASDLAITGRRSSSSALNVMGTTSTEDNTTSGGMVIGGYDHLYNNTQQHQHQQQHHPTQHHQPQHQTSSTEEERNSYLTWAANAVREYIVLAPCTENQNLPMNPDYPADLFTSCLTTPIPVALRWFIRKYPLSMEGVNPDVVDRLPGKLNDRKTPLGELNWIFTAITDTIAWNVLPSCLFQRLFRQDLLVASLFRNFLLADRILRSFNCTPVSYPAIPTPTWNHPLWEAWDLSVETCLYQLLRQGNLGPAWGVPTTTTPTTEEDDDGRNAIDAAGAGPGRINATCSVEDDDGNAAAATGPTPSPPPQQPQASSDVGDSSVMTLNVTSPFFSEQLTAFELWVEFAACRYGDSYGIPEIDPSEKTLEEEALEMKPPEQLPVVLQVLLSQAHRVRALVLLRRFLDLGPYAVNLALSVGIFPYVLKLLQSHIDEYKHVLVGIWAKILAFDPSCRIDLVKDGALSHFIDHLYWGLQPTTSSSNATMSNSQDAAEQRTMAAFILSSICFDFPAGQAECLRQNLHVTCCDLLLMAEKDFKDITTTTTTIEEENATKLSSDFSEEDEQFTSIFKMWLCICLGNMLNEMIAAQVDAYAKNVHLRLFSFLRDNSPSVRSAVAFALGALIGRRSSIDAFAIKPTLSKGGRKQQNGTGIMHLTRQDSFLPSLDEVNNNNNHNNRNGAPLAFQQMKKASTTQDFGTLDGDSFSVVRDFFAEVKTESALNSEERARLSLDLAVAKKLVALTSDASPAVRYETVMALGCCIEKYLPIFAEVANDNSTVSSDACSDEMKTGQGVTFIPSLVQSHFLVEIGSENAKDIRFVWAVVRDLQHRDPFPVVSDTAKTVVSVVYEYVLMLYGSRGGSKNVTAMSRILSMANVCPNKTEQTSNTDKIAPFSRSSLLTNLKRPSMQQLSVLQGALSPILTNRRRQSLHQPSVLQDNSMTRSYHGRPTQYSEVKAVETNVSDDLGSAGYQSQYKLPCSQYFLWLRSKFGRSLGITQVVPCRYVERRNTLVQKHIRSLAERFEILSRETADTSNKKSMTDTSHSFTNSALFFRDLETEEEEGARAAALEEEMSSKKKSLQMKQSSLLHNEGCAMSTMLAFHPYEPALIVCDASDAVSLWNINEAKKFCSFRNGNDKDSRMTSISWINEESKSLLITGANDGTLRIWQGLLKDDWTLSNERPTLVSAFLAEPDIVAGTRGSGLVMEWQQCTGQLVTAGSSSMLRCWDIETEKCCNEIDRNSEACVTALSTAWDSLFLDSNEKSYSGVGPNILVTGYGDGSIRIFDTRVNYRNSSSTHLLDRKRRKLIQFHEHNSWIVNTCFTGFGAKYEIMSASVAGDIKFWDLRLTSSARTLEIQRSPMTAFAGHPRIPMLATGSHDQFIKILTTDGDTLNVKRYHEVFNGSVQRIGPVSCLAFHPNKLLLAAGFTDEFLSIYSPMSC